MRSVIFNLRTGKITCYLCLQKSGEQRERWVRGGVDSVQRRVLEREPAHAQPQHAEPQHAEPPADGAAGRRARGLRAAARARAAALRRARAAPRLQQPAAVSTYLPTSPPLLYSHAAVPFFHTLHLSVATLENSF